MSDNNKYKQMILKTIQDTLDYPPESGTVSFIFNFAFSEVSGFQKTVTETVEFRESPYEDMDLTGGEHSKSNGSHY